MAESGSNNVRSSEEIDPANDPNRKAKSGDPGWKYGFWPNLQMKDLIQCSLCGKQIKQGIKRLKQHLAGAFGDVSKCPKTTPEIMREMQEALLSKQRNKPIRLDDEEDNDDDDVQEISGSATHSTGASVFAPSSGTSIKRKKAATLFEFTKPQPPTNSFDWWSAYGGRALDLATIAKRIVGLCCSSSGCERNWSTFEFIHTKRRNRLEHERLNDLVYIQYNEKIAERFQKRSELGKNFDPIVLEDFNWSGEWVGNPDGDAVHPGEDLLWDQVVVAAGPAVAVRNLRSRNRGQGGEASEETENRHSSRHYVRQNVGSSSSMIGSSSSLQLHDEDDIFPNDDEDIDDYGEIPTSSQSGTRKGGGNGDTSDLDDLII